jgi:hypothetical protein
MVSTDLPLILIGLCMYSYCNCWRILIQRLHCIRALWNLKISGKTAFRTACHAIAYVGLTVDSAIAPHPTDSNSACVKTLNVCVNVILICYCGLEIFKVCHIFEYFIARFHRPTTTLPWILVLRLHIVSTVRIVPTLESTGRRTFHSSSPTSCHRDGHQDVLQERSRCTP